MSQAYIIDAFVYRWTDSATGMMYVGVHKGTIDDGYVCSSKTMLEEYKKRPADFTRKILSIGTYSGCLYIETKILKSIDAKRKEDYYNRRNGGRPYIKSFTELHKQRISEKLKGRILNENQLLAMKMFANNGLGKKRSMETKLKISLSLKGKKIALGQKRSPESKKRISESLKGKPKSELAKMNMKIAQQNYQLNKKAQSYDL